VNTKTTHEKADDRKRIADDIRGQFNGAGMISASDAGRYLGLQKEAARKFLAEVPFIWSDPVKKSGKRMYLATELARKIYERQVP